jgi:predicted phosphodiesterase
MKIDFISDTHIDFWVKETNPQSHKFEKQMNSFIDIIKPNKHDVLIIAGDLGHYYNQDTLFLLKMKEYYTDIIVVPGNHDMYLVSKKLVAKYQYDSWNRILEMKGFCRDNGIHYFDGNSVCIKGITFGGAGMSWDGSYAKIVYEDTTMGEILGHWENFMNDGNLIYGGSDNYSVPMAYGGSHKVTSFDPLEFFDSQKAKLERVTNADVMISHYGPKYPEDISEHYKYDLTTTFYFFNGDDFLERLKPKYWVYGHTHRQVDEIYMGCNMLCNPLGYPDENTYTTIKTFEIEDIE